MKFEAARAEGERVVAELLRKFLQDTGNAKWIGRMAFSKIEQRFAGAKESSSAASPVSISPSVVTPPSEISKPTPEGTLSTWSILSASELIDYLDTCSEEDASLILAEERLKLARASVMEAAERRLGR
jgi:hypothetical protein